MADDQRLTVGAVLDEAERHLDEFDPHTSGAWPHAAAVLIRQSLESTLNGFWSTRAPGMLGRRAGATAGCACPPTWATSPRRARPTSPGRALSQACHHRAYEVGLTQDELRDAPGHGARAS